MRDHPRSPRQGSPAPQFPPRSLSDELGDFMSSTDDDEERDYDDSEEEEEDDDDQRTLATPMSSRKSSQDSFFDEDDEVPEEFPPLLKPFPAGTSTRKFARIDSARGAGHHAYASDDEAECATSSSRPGTARSVVVPPPFRRSSTCPVLTPDFLQGAADDVVKLMPEQADFMKKMVEGWREIQRRSSVSVLNAAPSPLSVVSPGMKRPNTAPSPFHPPPQMNFSSSFPRVPERLEEELGRLEEEPGSATESETEGGLEERMERVEGAIDELRVMAKESAEKAIIGGEGNTERFRVVERCIDTIGRVYEKKERGRRRRKLGAKCVGALVRICEMFASEGADGGSYRFESRLLDEITEDTESDVEDYADDEAEDDFIERFPDFIDGSFFGDGPTVVGDMTLPPPSPTKDPLDDRRHAALVEQARNELETLFAEAAEAETPFEERHSRVVYAVEAYLAKLSEMEAAHDRDFKWHAELKAFHVAMGSRNIIGSEPGTAMALVASLSLCFIPIATVLWYVTEPTTSWMLWRMLIPIGCYFLLLAGFYIDQKEAREALYEEHLPFEAREMRRRHKREKELLHAAHERAVQRVYSPEG
ncbi:hypothetical protein RB213_007809 [Colletotrichum asianum]